MKEMDLTNEDKLDFKKATHCHICSKKITSESKVDCLSFANIMGLISNFGRDMGMRGRGLTSPSSAKVLFQSLLS